MSSKKETTPAPKKAAKKTTKNSAVKKKTTDKPNMVCADGPLCFWMNDGVVVSNLLELKDAFDSMADEIYEYHVTNEKNDFADWVAHVLQDGELADGLRKSKKPKAARTLVVRRLKVYNV